MEDIIEIYEPIYRETFNFLPIIIGISSVIVIAGLLLLIKKIRKSGNTISPEQRYKKVLEEYLELQNSIPDLSTYDFSNKVADLFKNYLASTFSREYSSATTDELITLMNRDSTYRSAKLEELLENKLVPAQYGKVELENNIKNDIIQQCVEYITASYTSTGEDIA